MLLGDTELDRLPLAVVRRRILVSEPDPLIFSGTLRSELDPWARSSDSEITDAIEVAAAEDVLVALPAGLDEVVDERGRSFSGGQRQRLVLARALLADAEILVLVEPTSAVDAHTEARIARQLHDFRAGKTTVVVSSSPLVLDQADTVVLIADGKVQAEGTHRELLRTQPRLSRRRHPGGGRMTDLLPIAGTKEMRKQALELAGRHRRAMIGVLVLHALAAATGLVGPPLLGSLVQGLQTEIDTAQIDRVVGILAIFLVAQTVLTFFARRSSFVLSERMFAELRDDFMRRVLALPLSTVERAGIGDLVSRTTADVDALARTIRFAIPETSIACVTALLVVAAAVWVSPIAALPCLVGAPILIIGTRWYLRYAPAGYLWERAAYASMAGTAGETVDGGRTVESLGLASERARRIDANLADAYASERYTLRLRTIWFPTVDVAYVLPVVAALAWGGWLVANGHASVGEVTTVVLYIQQLADPVDRLLSWLDEVQVGGASFARLVGIADVPPDRTASGEEPEDDWLRAHDVRYAYVPGRDVLHGIGLDLEPGERIAVVGPSGAGKSTLGRLLAGIHPARTGSVKVGGVPLVDLELDTLRREVALVTQEQHVFVGTLADNLRLARAGSSDAELLAALEAVDATDWMEALPDGLETVVGAGGAPLTPAQTQQLALARLVLADPHTLVLDEATSLLDPRAARHLERSLASVLTGRTVVAIAHRLHTAHDADRVAVVENGLLQELGTHDELIENDGAYAALWESWQS